MESQLNLEWLRLPTLGQPVQYRHYISTVLGGKSTEVMGRIGFNLLTIPEASLEDGLGEGRLTNYVGGGGGKFSWKDYFPLLMKIYGLLFSQQFE